MNIDPHAYNISIRRGMFDGEDLFEARVKELPDVTEYAESYQEAYELAVDTIETAAAAFAEQRRPFPPAQEPADDFSGRVTLRIPRSLHRALAAAADEEGVSLNAHLVGVLTYYSGFAAGQRARISPGSQAEAGEQVPTLPRRGDESGTRAAGAAATHAHAGARERAR
jgi:predicted HicB family RNase H-like nuclease